MKESHVWLGQNDEEAQKENTKSMEKQPLNEQVLLFFFAF